MTEHVPVLIVGGGGAGLTASMLLSLLGVDAVLVNAATTTSSLPKAHVLNQRAMEIMSDCGVDEAIYQVGTPPGQLSHTAFYAGFAGPEPMGRVMYKQESWGGGGADVEWQMASPKVSSNLPQIRLEPLLKKRAEELAPGRVLFHHEVVALTHHDDYVEVVVVDHGSGNEKTLRSDFLIACDGGRSIGRQVGIDCEGPRDLARTVSIYVSADLSPWATDEDVLLRWIWSPVTGQMVVMAPMGPTKWGPHSEEWVIHTSYAIDDDRAFDDAAVMEDVRTALGIGDHPMDVHVITRWTIGGVVANKFRSGRVFVAGDAAHRHPPTGALGLTSAMHDVHNLCWKLAMVVRGVAGDDLLNTYEDERRPVDARNVARSLENSRGYAAISAALGFSDKNLTSDDRCAILQRLFSSKSEDQLFRQHVVQLMAAQSQEFREHDVEYGYQHVSSAVIDDGSPAKEMDEFRIHTPSTRPGSPLPHAWIEDWQMNRMSTLDLVPVDGFLLIAGEQGQPWCDAVREVARDMGVGIDGYTIGHAAGDFHDPRMRWITVREISPTGAILVRPDRCIAFRSYGAVENHRDVLHKAMCQILSKQ